MPCTGPGLPDSEIVEECLEKVLALMNADGYIRFYNKDYKDPPTSMITNRSLQISKLRESIQNLIYQQYCEDF